jgi:hypothetical protein
MLSKGFQVIYTFICTLWNHVAAHKVYQYRSVDLSARLKAFPSITESGRTRAQLDLSLRWEVITDLFWDLS